MKDMDKLIIELESNYFSIQINDQKSIGQTDNWIRENKVGKVYRFDDKYWFEVEEDRLHFSLRWIGEAENKS